MKDRLVLKDASIIELEAGASLNSLQVLSLTKEAMLAIWNKLTPENLSAVEIKVGEGLTVGRYTNLELVSETSIIQLDKSILTTYNLREKTSLEIRTDQLERGQVLQNGAIEEIGAIVGGTK